MIRRIPFLVLALFLAVESSAAPAVFVTTVAGVPGVAGSADGPAATAKFNRPTWLDVIVDRDCVAGEPGEIIVVDRANQALRSILGGTVKTLKIAYTIVNRDPIALDFGGPFGGGIAIEPRGGGCGCSYYARGVWVSTSASHQVALTSMDGVLASRDDIAPFIGLKGELTTPTGLAVSKPYARNFSERSLYVADSGAQTIQRVRFQISFENCPQHRVVETLAGARGIAGWQDGLGAAARFNLPRGLATSSDGSVYVADSGNHVIRRIAPGGLVTTIAGEPGVAGSDDHHLNTPAAVEVGSDGVIFIADTGNHAIRMLTPDGELLTIAGRLGQSGFADGSGADARFAGPVGLKLGLDGSLYVADTSNNVVRRLTFVDVEPRRRAVGQ